MSKRFGKIKLRWKYIITYVVVMLVPFSLLFSVFLAERIRVIQQDEKRIYTSYLTQCAERLDLFFSDLQYVASGVLNDDRLQWNNLMSSKWQEIQVKTELKSHNLLNPMPGQIYLCFRKSRIIYSLNGKTTLDAYARYSLKISDENLLDIENWLFSGSSEVCRTLRSPYVTPDYLLIRNYGSSNRTRDSSVVFIIPLNDFIDSVRKQLGSIDKYLAMADEQGRIITRPDFVTEKEALEILADNRTDPYSEVTGSKNLAFVWGKKVFGCTCALILPTSLVEVSIFSANPVLLIIALTLLLISLFGATFIALMVYRPINLIYKQVTTADGDSELETISNSIYKLQQENTSLHSLVEQKMTYVVDVTLEQLMHGKLDGQQGLSILAENGVIFAYPFFAILVVEYSGKSNLSMDRMRIACCLTETANRAKFSLVITEPSDADQTIAFVNMENETAIGVLTDQLKTVLADSERVGVSSITDKVSQFEAVYHEAVSSLDREQAQIVFWQNVNHKTDETMLNRLGQNLQSAIKEKNYTKSMSVLEALKEIDISQNEEVIQRQLTQIISGVLVYALSLNDDNVQNIVTDLVCAQQEKKTGMLENLDKLIIGLCGNNQTPEESEQERFHKEISDYIVDHFCDMDFCLESVAEHFGMSIYVASRYFCTSANENFKDMVARMRLERVKQLLEETDYPLKDIIQNVGYLDVSSFIKKFKKTEGITPGQYRNLKRG